MSETVSDVIVARHQQPDGLRTMIVWSASAHAGVIALLLLVPQPGGEPPPRTVMTISLGGAPGPRTGGMTQMGGRAVQAPPPEQPVRRAETPPAPARPAMTVPDPRAPVRPRTQPRQAPREATSRAPSTGEEPREGSTRTETRVRGQGFGLSSGGGGGSGVELDVGDFCCPEYLNEMITIIQRNWQQNQGVAARTTVKFTIARSGELSNIQVVRPSGFVALDLAAQRALAVTRQLPPLPAAFPNATLTVNMHFDYQR